MARYTSEQLANVRRVRNTLRRNGATKTEIRSAVATILVESNAQHQRYSRVGSGDRDSVGAFQQRPSQGWGPAGESIQRDAKQYLKVAKTHRGEGLTAGQLAQAVQRSGFPGRYAERMPEAKALLRQLGGAGGGQRHGGRASTYALTGRLGSVRPGTRPQLIPGGETVDRRGALVAALLDGSDGSLLKRWQGEISSGRHTTVTQPQVIKGTRAKYDVSGKVTVKGGAPAKPDKAAPAQRGTAMFDGKPVLAKFLPELQWARKHGWKGTVTSGVRTKAQQMAAARSFGLQHYGPAGPLGSNHVEGHRGAVDVSEPDALEQILRKYPGRRRLRRGMADDPVHFSPTGH